MNSMNASKKGYLVVASFALASLLLVSTIGAAEAKGKGQPQLSVYASAEKDPITRGSTQTIHVKVMDKTKTIDGATVIATVTYASGKTTKTFSGTTDSNGMWSFSWQIGGNSNPGTFTVDISAMKSGYDVGKTSLAFKVNPKN